MHFFEGRSVAGTIEAAVAQMDWAFGTMRRSQTGFANGGFGKPYGLIIWRSQPIQLGCWTTPPKCKKAFRLNPVNHREANGSIWLIWQIQQGMRAQLVVGNPAKAASCGSTNEV